MIVCPPLVTVVAGAVDRHQLNAAKDVSTPSQGAVVGESDAIVNERIRIAALKFAAMHLKSLEWKKEAGEPDKGTYGWYWYWTVIFAKLLFAYIILFLPELMAAFSFYSICQAYRHAETPRNDF